MFVLENNLEPGEMVSSYSFQWHLFLFLGRWEVLLFANTMGIQGWLRSLQLLLIHKGPKIHLFMSVNLWTLQETIFNSPTKNLFKIYCILPDRGYQAHFSLLEVETKEMNKENCEILYNMHISE